MDSQKSKSYVVTLLLSIFLGPWGLDHFYLGKTRTGFLKFLTLGGLTIWWIRDVITIIRGKTLDGQGRTLAGGDGKARKTTLLIFAGVVSVSLLGQLGYIAATGNWSTLTAPAEVKSDSNLGSSQTGTDSCFIIRTDVTMVESALREGKMNPPQLTALLDGAALDWTNESYNFTGSKSEWLGKMAELATKLSSYINTGSPSNGPLIGNQLQNNMALVDQFCG